jgi:hypothetical protein
VILDKILENIQWRKNLQIKQRMGLSRYIEAYCYGFNVPPCSSKEYVGWIW